VNFEQLPLHDAILGLIDIDWDEAFVKLNLHVFIEITKPAEPYQLKFIGVTNFSCTRDNEWGPSNSVLEVNIVGDEYQLQMQSGDKILIKADAFEFKYSGL
jgi:hypothetical protein